MIEELTLPGLEMPGMNGRPIHVVADNTRRALCGLKDPLPIVGHTFARTRINVCAACLQHLSDTS